MKSKLLFFICFVALPLASFCDPAGDKALAELSQRVRDLGAYESQITLKMNSDKVEGEYRIDGSNYHIDLGNVEFWGIGDKRYEVSHKIEEVVIERADSGNNTLMANPSQAFELADQGFDAETIDSQAIRLRPKSYGSAQIDVDQIDIYLDTKSKLPSRISYTADEECIEIEFRGMKKSNSPLGEFDLSKFKRYDIVDLY